MKKLGIFIVAIGLSMTALYGTALDLAIDAYRKGDTTPEQFKTKLAGVIKQRGGVQGLISEVTGDDLAGATQTEVESLRQTRLTALRSAICSDDLWKQHHHPAVQSICG